jgi:hypothetical protein
MKWTYESPQVPGFYFVKWPRASMRVVKITNELCDNGSHMELFANGYGVHCSVSCFGQAQWAGPIQEPTENEK